MDGDRDFRFSPRPNRAGEIKWRPWGEPAFAEARRLGRPVLLSLSAVWCHWCHVMDETSYSDPRVIAAVNEHFVPVRVDNDRRPDVNRRYNMGGWPTTAFLAPSGDVLTGATYLPPEQMLEALARVNAFFDANRATMHGAARASAATDGERRDRAKSRGRPRALRGRAGARRGRPRRARRHLAEVALQVVRAFDPVHGGLGAEPKFPQPDVYAFMLAYGLLRGGGIPTTCRRAAARSCARRACTRSSARRSRPWRAAGCTTSVGGRVLPLRHAARLVGAALREDARGQRPARRLYAEASVARRRPRARRRGRSTGAPPRGARRLPARHPVAGRGLGVRRQPGRRRALLRGSTRTGGRSSCRRPSSTRPSTWTGTRSRRGRCCAARTVLDRPELADRAVRLLDHLWDARRGDAVAALRPRRRPGRRRRRCSPTRRPSWPRRCSTPTRSRPTGAGCARTGRSPSGPRAPEAARRPPRSTASPSPARAPGCWHTPCRRSTRTPPWRTCCCAWRRTPASRACASARSNSSPPGRRTGSSTASPPPPTPRPCCSTWSGRTRS